MGSFTERKVQEVSKRVFERADKTTHQWWESVARIYYVVKIYESPLSRGLNAKELENSKDCGELWMLNRAYCQVLDLIEMLDHPRYLYSVVEGSFDPMCFRQLFVPVSGSGFTAEECSDHLRIVADAYADLTRLCFVHHT
jgi:hypothetical protein